MAHMIKLLLRCAILSTGALAWVVFQQPGVAVPTQTNANDHVSFKDAMANAVIIQKNIAEAKAEALPDLSSLNPSEKAALSKIKDKIAGLQKELDAKTAELVIANDQYDGLMTSISPDTVEALKTKETALTKTLDRITFEQKLLEII